MGLPLAGERMEKENYIFFKGADGAYRPLTIMKTCWLPRPSRECKRAIPNADMQRFLRPIEGFSAPSGGVAHYFIIEGFVAFLFITISQFLALDTIGGPRYGSHALRADFFLAMEARSKGAVVNSPQR